MDKLIITPDTKILEMITEYPELEDKLIEAAPVFSKLKNPVLRKTVARVTTIRQAAVVGGLNLSDLIVLLRKAVNQDTGGVAAEKQASSNRPDWIDKFKCAVEYDAILDIDRGVHPLGKVVSESASLADDEFYLLITNFIPKPLIDTLAAKGFEVFNERLDDSRFGTYIKKL